jgi:diadenosine tetraphosphate (Ap4A) HIT family hydrolase
MQYNKDNIFNKIIKKEIPSQIIFENDKLLAFKDVNPQAPVHILLVPKGDFVSFDDFTKNSSAEDVANFFKKAQEIAENQGVKEYKILANCGEKAGQFVMHFHLHIIGGWK